MVVLGFIIIALAVAAVCVLIGQNTANVEVSALGGTWNVDMYWLVVAGIVLTAAAILGMLLVVLGGARARKQRQHRKELERENKRLASQVGASSASAAPSNRNADGSTHHVHDEPAPAPPPAPANDAFPPAGSYPPPPPAGYPSGTAAPPRNSA